MAEVRTTSSTGGQKGVKLARFDLIPAGPHRELAEHYGIGASKYADNQWRNGYEWSKSIAALERHFNDFKAGKDYDVCSNDPEGCQHVDTEGRPFVAIREDACFNHTGSHHMAAVAWHAFGLLEFKDVHPGHDDRYKAPEPEIDFDKMAEDLIGGRGYRYWWPEQDAEVEPEPLGDDWIDLGYTNDDGSKGLRSDLVWHDEVTDFRSIQDAINRTVTNLLVDTKDEEAIQAGFKVGWKAPEPPTSARLAEVMSEYNDLYARLRPTRFIAGPEGTTDMQGMVKIGQFEDTIYYARRDLLEPFQPPEGGWTQRWLAGWDGSRGEDLSWLSPNVWGRALAKAGDDRITDETPTYASLLQEWHNRA